MYGVSYGRYNQSKATKDEGGIDFTIVDYFKHPKFVVLNGAPSWDVAIWKVEPVVSRGQRPQDLFKQIQYAQVAQDETFASKSPHFQAKVTSLSLQSHVTFASKSPHF